MERLKGKSSGADEPAARPVAEVAISDEKVEEKVAKIGRDLADHYVIALNKIKTDVLEYIERLKQHHGRTMEAALSNERRRIAKTLKRYYVHGIEQICHRHRDGGDPGVIQSHLEKLMHSDFESLMVEEEKGVEKTFAEDASLSKNPVPDSVRRLLAGTMSEAGPSAPKRCSNGTSNQIRSRHAGAIAASSASPAVPSTSPSAPSKDLPSQSEVLRAAFPALDDTSYSSHSRLSPVPRSEKSAKINERVKPVKKTILRAPSPLQSEDEYRLPPSPSPLLKTISFAEHTLTDITPLSAGLPCDLNIGSQEESVARELGASGVRNANLTAEKPSSFRREDSSRVETKREKFASSKTFSGHSRPVSNFDYNASVSFISNATSYFELPHK